MTQQADTDVSTPKFLRDKYAIVGVGEPTYLHTRIRQDDTSPRHLGFAQCRRGCGHQDLGHRRHAVIFRQ